MAGGPPSSFGRRPTFLIWQVTLESFNAKVEDQMSHLRGQMKHRVEALELEVQKFASRW